MIIENTQEMIELGKRIGENLKPQMIITLWCQILERLHWRKEWLKV